ncbi:MAG TPA: hypothetical protein PLO43_04835, partial [Chlamydiales bacterium]|nr:hypothetical protein [Chlamydiales bacterium]
GQGRQPGGGRGGVLQSPLATAGEPGERALRVPVGMSAGGGRMCPLGHTPTATGTPNNFVFE